MSDTVWFGEIKIGQIVYIFYFLWLKVGNPYICSKIISMDYTILLNIGLNQKIKDFILYYIDYPVLLHIHLGLALTFLLSYTIKSILFLSGKRDAFLAYKKKTLLIETLISVGFLLTGISLIYILLGFDGYKHWLDPKITLALIGIPLGIIGFKKENKIMVTVSLAFFVVAMVIGLMHYH